MWKRIRETECKCGHSHHIICDEIIGVIISGTITQTKIENEYWNIKSLFPIQSYQKCVVWQFLLDWFDINSTDSSHRDFIMGFTDKTANLFDINCNGYKIYQNIKDNSVKVFNKTLKQNDTISFILYLTEIENKNESNRVIIAINNEYMYQI